MERASSTPSRRERLAASRTRDHRWPVLRYSLRSDRRDFPPEVPRYRHSGTVSEAPRPRRPRLRGQVPLPVRPDHLTRLVEVTGWNQDGGLVAADLVPLPRGRQLAEQTADRASAADVERQGAEVVGLDGTAAPGNHEEPFGVAHHAPAGAEGTEVEQIWAVVHVAGQVLPRREGGSRRISSSVTMRLWDLSSSIPPTATNPLPPVVH